MKDNFKLYINNNQVDFAQDFNTTFTYQVEDLTNPSAVKNNYSKTIQIEGTPNNNKIFGEIYNLERTQIYDFDNLQGVYFDASKRTPFALYHNNMLIESGYMQLNNINVKNKVIIYNITLYGGLGDFFYSLMYNENGEKRTLSDLWFKVTEDKENELNFNITKEFVRDCWINTNQGATGKTIYDLISFAPSYNGLYENDFDNSTFLVNTKNNYLFPDNSVTEDGKTFTSYRGYKLAKIDKELTEWEALDLRSYMQRPVIKVSKVLDAIFDADNNGGYSVNLDKSFFNQNNPYYEKSYLALPMLINNIEETPEELLNSNISTDTNIRIGYYDNYGTKLFYEQFKTNLVLNGDITTDSYGFIDLTDYPINSTFDIDVDFSLITKEYGGGSFVAWQNAYLSYGNPVGRDWNYYYNSILVQLKVVNEGNIDEVLFYSDVYNFSNKVFNGSFSTPDKWINYPQSDKNKYNFVNINGNFKRVSGGLTFFDTNGNENFRLSLKNISAFKPCRILIDIKYVYNTKPPTLRDFILSSDVNCGYDGMVDDYGNFNTEYFVKGYCKFPIGNTSQAKFNIGAMTLNSGKLITKKDLLKGDITPTDFLTSYCKMFGLFFTKDIDSKTISITTKNNFYNGKVINLDDKINWENVVITPQLYTSKYFLLKSEDNENHFTKKYKDDYSITYGQKRIDTGYNFNQDEKNIFEGSVFKNGISILDTSNYYYTCYDKNNNANIAPSWILENPTIELFNGVEQDNKTVKEIVTPYSDIISNTVTQWNVKKGYDIFPKNCFYTMDKSVKSLSDATGTLLIYNGMKDLTDTANNFIPYYLTDDLQEMTILNEGKICFINTVTNYDTNDNLIAIKLNNLPQFTRHIENSNTIIDSLDFGQPKELYIPNINYNEYSTIYNKFWSNYLEDRYNVNTRKVTCNVMLDKEVINQDILRNFYFFNNSYWIMNKIENTYPYGKSLPKVEFIKVNNLGNYTNGQISYYTPTIVFDTNNVIVNWDVTKYVLNITANNDWYIDLPGNLGASVTGGTIGEYEIELRLPMNSNYVKADELKTFNFNFVCGNETTTFKITRTPNLNYAKHIFGYVYNAETKEPYNLDFTIESRNIFSRYETDVKTINGYYDTYLPAKYAEDGSQIKFDFTNTILNIDSIVYKDWDDIPQNGRIDFPL